MKENKEIIDEIVDRLRSQSDHPYREEAWEKFQRLHLPKKVQRLNTYKALSAAAILLFLGIGGILFVNREADEMPSSTDTIALQNELINPDESKDSTADRRLSSTKTDQNSSSEEPVERSTQMRSVDAISKEVNAKVNTSDNRDLLVAAMDPEILSRTNMPELASLDRFYYLPKVNFQGDNRLLQKNPEIKSQRNLSSGSTLASAQAISVIGQTNLDDIAKSSRFRLNEKFDLGLYVSPTSTAEKMNVGGGLVIAYNVSSKVSFRTGASYNTYEVGMLKNPKEPSSVETVALSSSSKNMAAQADVLLPNINAVTGMVQSLEIPLELKYNFNKSLYAAGGVSYSAILHQERSAHYVENLNSETFSNGYPEDSQQMAKSTQAMTRTVKSAENNVNATDFNGFVNFSLGKKVNVGKRFGISVEPYVKIPVGSYQRADMDYTNGGIRIMTNF